MPRLTPPKRKTGEERNAMNFRLTVKEKAMFDAAASLSGETRSSWMRRTLIEAALYRANGTVAYDALLAMGAIRKPTSLQKVHKTPDEIVQMINDVASAIMADNPDR